MLIKQVCTVHAGNSKKTMFNRIFFNTVFLSLILLSAMKLQSQNKTDFQFDNQNRIVKISYDNGCSIYYTYDPLGNRLTKSRTILMPVAAGTITGTSAVCKGANSVAYSVPVIVNAAWYIWSLPPGATIISGDSTRSILVDFSLAAQSGSFTVYGRNDGGSGTVSAPFGVTVTGTPAAAGVIQGPSQVTQGQTGVAYSVAPISGATGYQWTLPAGAVITGGAGSNSITMNFSLQAVSGTISVVGTNSCGTGITSPAFTLTVSTGVPAAITIQGVTVPAGQPSCFNATQTIAVAGNGTSFLVPSGGNATLIAGQKISFLPGTQVQQGGYMLGAIKPNGPWCTNAKSAPLTLNLEPSTLNLEPSALNPVSSDDFRVKAWPNPVSGMLNVSWDGNDLPEETILEIRNLLGKPLIATAIKGKGQVILSLKNLLPGMYLLHVVKGHKSKVIKLVRN